MSAPRWTQADLDAYQQRTNRSVASSFGGGIKLPPSTQQGATSPLRQPLARLHASPAAAIAAEQPALNSARTTTATSKSKGGPNAATKRMLTATESVRNAVVTGSFYPSRSLELVFSGARMLSINDLFALTHFQRVKYRKAWHEAIEHAVLQVVGAKAGQLRAWNPMTRFRLHAERHALDLCDTDNLHHYFKYPIDGLRYAGIILDDKPHYFISMSAAQHKGPYAMKIRVDAVTSDEPQYCSAFLAEPAAVSGSQ